MKQSIKYFIIIIGVAVILVGSLFLSAMIPQELIHDNVLESAEEIATHGLFEISINNVKSSALHYYADAITFNIAYNLDTEHPISSVISAMYYATKENYTNKDLLDCVTKGLEPNKEYARYWHGGIAVIRPLLVIFNAVQIRIAMYVMLFVLLAILFYQLYRRGSIAEIVILSIAILVTFTFLTPLVLEYIWMILLMLLFSIVALNLQGKNNDNALLCMFAVDGIAVAFFDFLTIETVTLLLPLILILMQRHKNQEFGKKEYIFSLQATGCWGAAFAGMWSFKWVLTKLVMKWTFGDFLTGHIEERSIGKDYVSQFDYILGAISNNVSMLFPFCLKNYGIICGVFIIIVILYLMYVYRRDKWDKNYVHLMLILSLVPFIRYLVMRGHSYEHYFFTYRALISSIIAWGAIFIEIVNIQGRKKGRKNRK